MEKGLRQSPGIWVLTELPKVTLSQEFRNYIFSNMASCSL